MSAFNPGKTMDRHYQLQTESRAGSYNPVRKCAGACKTRRSCTQFDDASAVCRRCVLRAPKPAAMLTLPRATPNQFNYEVTKP